MSTTSAAWWAVIGPCLLTVAGAIWRLGTKVGTFAEKVQENSRAIAALWWHVNEHDRWHRDRLAAGLDKRA